MVIMSYGNVIVEPLSNRTVHQEIDAYSISLICNQAVNTLKMVTEMQIEHQEIWGQLFSFLDQGLHSLVLTTLDC